MDLLVIWNEVIAHLVTSHHIVLFIKAANDRFITNSAHYRHVLFKISIFTADVFIKTRLEESVESFSSKSWLTFAVQNTQEIELINSKNLFICLDFVSLLLGRFVFEIDKNVIMVQNAPVKRALVIEHCLKVLIAFEGYPKLFHIDSVHLLRVLLIFFNFENELLEPIFVFLQVYVPYI